MEGRGGCGGEGHVEGGRREEHVEGGDKPCGLILGPAVSPYVGAIVNAITKRTRRPP